jgi:imidazolonepropionase-like amidohydrolase
VKSTLSRLLLLLAAFAPASGAETLFIRNAAVHTMTEQGVMEGGSILIRDGRIEAVGVDLDTPGDARTIDGSGLHVTPGLISAYTQLGLVEIDLVAQTSDSATTDILFSASFTVAPALNPHSTLVPYNRRNGLLHAVVAPAPGHHVFSGRGAVIRLGSREQFMVHDGVAVFATYGSPGGLFAGGSRAAAYGRMRLAFLEALELERNRKAISAGNWRDLTLPYHDLEALVPVIRGQLPIVINTHRAADILALLDLRREFSLRLVIAGASEAWMVAGELAEAGVPVIIDPLANLPQNFDRLGARLDNAALLHAAGVKVLFSSAGYLATHGAFLVRQGAGNAAAHGLPRQEALRAMTRNVAEVFGFGDRFGSIAPGREADLVLWDGDPLEVLTRVDKILIGGELIATVSRADRLRERYRELPGTVPFPYRK